MKTKDIKPAPIIKTTYKMSTTHDLGQGYQVIGDKRTVKEEEFYQSLNDEVKKLTEEQPDKFEETMQKAKDCIKTGKALTVNNVWFQIITKRTK
jgi:hypothetical protein